MERAVDTLHAVTAVIAVIAVTLLVSWFCRDSAGFKIRSHVLWQHVTAAVRDVIPSALGGSDILATAETGTTWVESDAEVEENSSLWNVHQASSFHLKEKLHGGKLPLLFCWVFWFAFPGWHDRFRQDGLILVANARAPVSGLADNGYSMTAAI